MEVNRQCQRCKETKPESSFNIDYVSGELSLYCIFCYRADKKCTKCKKTKPLSSFSEIQQSIHKSFVICMSCDDEIQERMKSNTIKIFMALSAVLLFVPNFVEVNYMGICILWMMFLLVALYFSDPHREGDTRDVIEHRNGTLLMVFIPTLIMIIALAFLPESCEFKFTY